MEQESNIYGTVVKRTVMEEGLYYSKCFTCTHSPDTIHHTKKPGKWSHVLLLSVIFLSLGGSIPVGYICGTSTNPYHVEDSWVELPMSNLRTLLLVGGVVGTGVSAILTDWAGRRYTTLVSQMIGTVGAATHLAASLMQSETILIVAWLILGLFIGVAVCVVPLYLVELAPYPLRMSVATVFTVGTSLGLMLSETLSLHSALAIGKGHSFLVPAFAFLLFVSWFFFRHVPESPSYLYFIVKDKNLAALELAKLCGSDVASAEAEFDNRCLQKETSHPLMHLILLLLLCGANTSQALGESDQLYHISEARPRLSESDVVAAGYTASVVNCIVALMLVQLITTVSWRVLLITSCVSSSVLLFVMAAFALLEDTSNKTVYFMLATLLVQVIVFDLGLRAIPCYLATELFGDKTSTIMMSVGGAVNFLGQLVSDQMFLLLGVAYFRFIAALFLASFAVLLLISLPKDSSSRDKPKVHSSFSHLPNP
ncbi:solute carrier family 2, facilitated glucose transporter member 5-like [Macrosteles quadrilineatus]|uniref:solute carrier family 2, facilitated glucose transporter member 5-like n=1 Tax=Macrosteles quadrilineatus TaxID=74068 RepID=UPI0023E0EA59|nr:solute carrier family 2, facilitated glucose transporter member 5-like [Macrosteles quadrilineatus]